MKLLIILFFILLSIVACKTEEPQNPPTVLTTSATDVQLKSAILGGEVTEEGFSATTERGFVFSDKNTNPSVSDNKVQSGFGKGAFSILIDRLNVNSKYYFKAYAVNTKGTSYGTLQSFTTSDYKLAVVTTNEAKNITDNSVELLGSVIDEGGGAVSESGMVIGLNASPLLTDLKFPISKGKTNFSIVVTKLAMNTKYYARSYALNEKGANYGNEINFTTQSFPTVKSKTGKIWMDRNLGASQVATSSIDILSYGDLYQWGREKDGHQIRSSKTTKVLSIGDTPGNDSFILVSGNTFNEKSQHNWRVSQNNNLWQGVNGVNNVCPNGFRLPTNAEWRDEIQTWSSPGSDGAFNSPLKLPLAGKRNHNSGTLEETEFSSHYWTSDTYLNFANVMIFSIQGQSVLTFKEKANGSSVRCIKD